MKLTAIRLENVRRFSDPVEIRGIGPGLNLLSAPNEQGKSTIFDALHALFFKDAKSWDKDVRSLAPHSGGDPLVAVEIDLDGTGYRIEKQFTRSSGKGEVRIWQQGQLFKQADAAETWLRALIKSPKDGGPAGLLWVRQGITAFEDAKDTLLARRDLLSSVTGEVEMVTGGQRMDEICRQVQLALDGYVTKRGAKTGGPLDQARRTVADLEDQQGQLAAQVQELRQFLDQRLALRGEQATLNAAQDIAQRQDRLDQARAALEQAEQHHEKLTTASSAAETAQMRCDSHRRSIAALDGQLREQAAAAADLQAQDQALADQTSRHQQDQAQLASARSALQQATTATGAARQMRDRVLQAETADRTARLRQQLQDRLQQGQDLAARMDALQPLAAKGPDPKVLAGIETCREQLALADQARQSAAAAVTLTYQTTPPTPLLLDGVKMPVGTRLPLPDGGLIQVPGLADLQIHPGRRGDEETLTKAQQALTRALQQAGCDSIEAARQAARKRAAATAELQELRKTLALLLPDGIEALHQQLADLPEAAEAPEAAQADLPDRAAADQALAACQQAEQVAMARAEQARTAEQETATAVQRLSASREAAATRLQRAMDQLDDPETQRGALQQLVAELPQLDANLSAAQATVQALQQAAPDVGLARAALQRAQSVVASAAQRNQEITTTLAGLEARIDTHASRMVEEELAEVEGRLDSARQRLAAIEFEVAVLTRLAMALEQARQEAQDHYVGPVLREMEPLLRMMWPDARLALDADQVLPDQLLRGGGADAFDILSGGTQEQIALLVRLAFARLLARGGQPAPVILDDAIVYTDDARLERIFDVLTHQAGDLQILVFSCRQAVFRNLGGTQLSITPA